MVKLYKVKSVSFMEYEGNTWSSGCVYYCFEVGDTITTTSNEGVIEIDRNEDYTILRNLKILERIS